jgi:hypothetical protein
VLSVLFEDDTKNRISKVEIGIHFHRLPNCSMNMDTRNIRIKIF